MAGESARERAATARAKAERLERYAAQWEKGAEGEARTAAVLDAGLPPGWTVLHDLRWPGRDRANLDHVAVGPQGIFVVDSKNWSGQVTVRDDVLRQDGWRREKAVAGCADAALDVARHLPDVSAHVVPVLCFCRDELIETTSRGVLLRSTSTLVPTLVSRPAVWGDDEVQRVVERLGAMERVSIAPRLPTRSAPRRATARPRRVVRGRRPSRTRTVLGGLVLWWLGCMGVDLAIGPTLRQVGAEQLQPLLYLLVGLLVLSSIVPRRRRRRTGRRRT
jgi:hypothetical protein